MVHSRPLNWPPGQRPLHLPHCFDNPVRPIDPIPLKPRDLAEDADRFQALDQAFRPGE